LILIIIRVSKRRPEVNLSFVVGILREITAIPLLINSLELSGCIVTIDAMGCQKDITQTIIGHDANYIIAIKENKKKIINRLNKSLTIIRIEMK